MKRMEVENMKTSLEGDGGKDINSKPLPEIQRSNERTPRTFLLVDFFCYDPSQNI